MKGEVINLAFAADIAEALKWADSAIIDPAMAPFDSTRRERQYAKTLAEGLRFFNSMASNLQNRVRELEAADAEASQGQFDQVSSLNNQIARLMAERDAAVRERDQRPAICAFCSWGEGPASTTLEQIQAHSSVCEFHPLRAQLAAKEAELQEHIGDDGNGEPTRCDMKIRLLSRRVHELTDQAERLQHERDARTERIKTLGRLLDFEQSDKSQEGNTKKRLREVIAAREATIKSQAEELDTIKKWSQAQHDADGEVIAKLEATIREQAVEIERLKGGK